MTSVEAELEWRLWSADLNSLLKARANWAEKAIEAKRHVEDLTREIDGMRAKEPAK